MLVSDSICLLVCIKSRGLIFFAKKMWETFALQKFLIFLAKNGSIFVYKVKVFHSLIAVGAVGARVPLYLGHS